MSSQRVHGWANVRVRDEQTGRTVNVNSAEDTAFWQWACIETLRHTGARNEVLLELSQLSIRQYVRPNGEVIALLVIAPSKTDRERVVPMTAELFHVIACIIRRLTRGRPSIALATRYDKHEHVTSEPQPHQPTGNRVSAGDRRRMGREQHFDKRKSSSASADAPMPPRANTSTPASVAPCCASTRR